MDTVHSMRIFSRVAQLGGFASAARDLRLSNAAVTKHVAALEERTGARLLNRTTRKVSLTEAGRVYLERCLECLQVFEDAEGSVRALSSAPSGVLRLAAPGDFPHLAPILAAFADRCPGVTVEVRLSNRIVDLVEEGIDLALRVAMSLDAAYVARPLAVTRAGLWASPRYLEKYGRPRRPEDLAKHRALLFSEPVVRDELTLTRGARKARVKLTPYLTTNSGDIVLASARLGMGVAVIPSMLACTARRGELELLLPEWSVFSARLYACYPHRRHLAPKVRAFLELLRETFGNDPERDPWWPAA
jgi:DNA-binding transcriptional LysR family regulator